MSSVSRIGSLLYKALQSVKNNCRCICIFQCCVSDTIIDEEISQMNTPLNTPLSTDDLFSDYFHKNHQLPNLDEVPDTYGTCHTPKATL
jgi:hypothetical protein